MGAGIVALSQIATAFVAASTDLPRSKVNVVHLQRRHTGPSSRVRRKISGSCIGRALYFRFLIAEPDGSELIKLCDGLSGAIVRTQYLADVETAH